ncbi:hypothetical protein LEP1GSC163_0152 [Leptospira santarosai str. CBC379]|uniref:hypothetical protein n=1 Tax=Leptospira santarosai TaxID=28183 RepID=UPI0002972576|nr:hypothetical protein [Leptospira santarosai]EKR89726.1 hypothetical protein LEP1GSC163_0152 [Leptospira santarosai str. CBC379]
MKDKFKQWKEGFLGPFMKSETPPPDDNPSSGESNPDEGGESAITEELISKLQAAIEKGEVKVEEGAIKEWCKANGLEDEDAQTVWDTLKEITDGETPPSEENKPDKTMEKGGLDSLKLRTELKQFSKSLNSLSKRDKEYGAVLALLIKDNEASEKQISEFKTEIEFLKSEIQKIGGLPNGEKRSTTSIDQISDNQLGTRDQIIKKLFKGVQEKAITMGDLQAYKSQEIFTEPAKLFLKSLQGEN